MDSLPMGRAFYCCHGLNPDIPCGPSVPSTIPTLVLDSCVISNSATDPGTAGLRPEGMACGCWLGHGITLSAVLYIKNSYERSFYSVVHQGWCDY